MILSLFYKAGNIFISQLANFLFYFQKNTYNNYLLIKTELHYERKMAKVYITQHPRPNRNNWSPDFSSAFKYGGVDFIFTADENPCEKIKQSIKVAVEKLKKFNPDEDYVCWPNTGDPVSLYITIQVLTTVYGFNTIKYLFWNKKRLPDGNTHGYYLPVEVEVEEKSEPNYNF